MLPQLSHHRPAKIRWSSRRAFTLIEIMVVVSIIIILVGILVAVGTQVKRHAQTNSTKTTLEILRGTMSDYLRNNPEPSPTVPPGAPVLLPFTMVPTNNWLPALKSDAAAAVNLKNIPGYSANPTVILDAFGGTIVYIHSVSLNGSITAPGYFVSPGPDGKLGVLGKTPTDPDAADDIFGDSIAP